MWWYDPDRRKWIKLQMAILRKAWVAIVTLYHTVRRKWRLLKAKRYKQQKIKEERLAGERDYELTFDIIFDDDETQLRVDDVYIVVPAQSLFGAKKKLNAFLQHKMRVEVKDFQYAGKEEVKKEEDRRGPGLDADKDDGGRKGRQ